MDLRYVLAFALGLAPSLIWLTFFEQEEKEKKEHLSDIIFAFLVGAVTTFVALFAQVLLAKYFGAAGIGTRSTGVVAIFAGIEEAVKFLGVFLLVRRRKSFDQPLDAMIFMITAALGFAAVENIASLINSGGVQAAFVSIKAFEVVALRFLGATLLHSVASGIIGFHWAVGWIRGKLLGVHILAGLVISTVLHAAFNCLVLAYGPASWALVFVAIIAFFLLVDFEELRTEQERDGLVPGISSKSKVQNSNQA
jgi:RsiW-degrading membrane proteinase PrsW (M82 family)